MDKDIIILSGKIMNMMLRYLAITAVILLIIFPSRYSLALGLVFGGIVSLINFYLIAYSVNNIIYHKVKSKYYYAIFYILRMLLYGLAIAAAYILNSLNLVTTIIGLMSLKIALLIQSLRSKNHIF